MGYCREPTPGSIWAVGVGGLYEGACEVCGEMVLYNGGGPRIHAACEAQTIVEGSS